jgi:ubiquinone/menaquinone biosynthesis C-methylase UbiE
VDNTENLREYFNRQAPNRASRNGLNAYYWNDITRCIDYFIDENSSVLEIGCGTGNLLKGLKSQNKSGIDFSEDMISLAQKNNPDSTFHVMNAEQITLGKTYDVVVLSNLVGYLPDVQAVFEELNKVCHDRTKVIVNYYSKFWEPFLNIGEKIGIKTKGPDQNWLTQQDIINLLDLAGFEVYRSNRRMLLPINIPVLSFLLNRYIAKLPFFRAFCINHFCFAQKKLAYRAEEVSEKYSVSVVIPARNESGNIENAILRTPKLGRHTEIIFIEGNSTDDTWATIQRVQEKYKNSYDIKIGQQEGKGKGDAVRKGFGMATGDILMILDADLTVPPEDLPKFYNALATGKGGFINGSRLVYAMDKKAMRFLNMLGNKFFSWAFSWLLEQPFRDTLCGTKVIFRDDYQKLISNRKFFGEFDPFGDFDLIFGAYKLNLKIVEVPIRYKERTYGDTNISRFKHGLILLRMCAFASRKIKFY